MVRTSILVIVCAALVSVGTAARAPADASQDAEGPSLRRRGAAVAVGVDPDEPAWPRATLAATSGMTRPVSRGPADDACPGAMVLVDGDHCANARQECARWLDSPTTPLARCARFAPTVCTGGRTHERFCIDRDEYVAAGESLPMGGVSWSDARQACERDGKRLCRETEWELACEGDETLPYPTGYARDSVACNFDRGNLVDKSTGKLRDQRMPPSSLDRCLSPFGVRSMTGNVDEWVWRDRTPGPWRSALKGGWWMAARERCRPATTSHNEHYRALQTGFRCCADPLD